MKKILVVDDDPTVLAAVSGVLARLPAELSQLSTAIGFGAALSRIQPDLVVLDVNMPLLGAETLIQNARKRGVWFANIILHSAMEREALSQLATSLNVAGFVSKNEGLGALVMLAKKLLAATETSTPAASPAQGGASVVVIDDDVPWLSALRRAEPAGTGAVYFSDSSKAFDYIRNAQGIDVIASDISMPGMTGADLYWRIHEQDPALASRLVFVTAYANDDFVSHFAKSWRGVLMKKPLPAEEFWKTVLAAGNSTHK